MAAHSTDGIAAAVAGKQTLRDIVADPARYGAGAPRAVVAESAHACWSALSDGVAADVWVPTCPTDEPPGFTKRAWTNPGLRRQPANYVSQSVSPQDAVVPSAVMPALPHAGKHKRLLEAFVDPEDCPVPATFECADGEPGSAPYAAIAVIEGVAEDDSGVTVYKCRWHGDPAADTMIGKPAPAKLVGVSDGKYVGSPEYTLLTADTRLNHASNMASGNWWKGAHPKLNVTASGMALWRTAVAEVTARASGSAGPCDAPTVLGEHASRASAGKRRRP